MVQKAQAYVLANLASSLSIEHIAREQNPELAERLSAEALQPMPMSPEAFGRYIRDDIGRWTKLANERHIEIND